MHKSFLSPFPPSPPSLSLWGPVFESECNLWGGWSTNPVICLAIRLRCSTECGWRCSCQGWQTCASKSFTFTPSLLLGRCPVRIVVRSITVSHVVTADVTRETCDKQIYIYLTASAPWQPKATLSLGLVQYFLSNCWCIESECLHCGWLTIQKLYSQCNWQYIYQIRNYVVWI